MKISLVLNKFHLFLLLIVVSCLYFVPKYLKKQSLIQTINDSTNAFVSGDYKKMYDSYSDDYKNNVSNDYFLETIRYWRKPKSIKYDIKSVDIVKDIATVISYDKYCFIDSCEESDYKIRHSRSVYKYDNSHWFGVDVSICNRSNPYDMPEEFKRAVSIVIQRFSESPISINKQYGQMFNSIRNCLNIQYAEDDNLLNGADGVFTYSSDSNLDDYRILVSRSYKSTDDLVTAVLLSHEMYHALLNARGEDILLPCFTNEGNAFMTQGIFYELLNDGERKSIDTRILANNSEHLSNVSRTFRAIHGTKGKDEKDKYYQYVMNDPYYIEQCKE